MKRSHTEIKKPWLTNGLLNAMKKRRCLYWVSVKLKTEVAKEKYQKYRNKLTSILRSVEKSYYSELLQNCKNDMKKTWQIINNCIKRGKSTANFPDYFCINGKKIYDHTEAANGFNEFFTHVDPNLAKNINECKSHKFSDFVKYSANNSMFLEPTCTEEVLNVIKSCDSKTSIDFNGFDMNIVKKIGSIIAEPFTAICNMSFKQGVFPDKMKIA